MHIEQISSTVNPKVKSLVQLKEKSRVRRDKGLFTVEGIREVNAALKSGYKLKELYFNPEIADLNTIQLKNNQTSIYDEYPIFSVNKAVYSKIAYREGTEGVVAVFEVACQTLDQTRLSSLPLIIIMESVEKPGNLGAVLRTSDAVRADAVIICDPLTDIFNPNIIRSSLGALFTNQVVACSSQEAYSWLSQNKIAIFSAQLQDSVPFHKTDMTIPMAIVMGSESQGVTQFWREKAHKKIHIPMLGRADSLNVSVSAAVLCYEAIKQRDLK